MTLRATSMRWELHLSWPHCSLGLHGLWAPFIIPAVILPPSTTTCSGPPDAMHPAMWKDSVASVLAPTLAAMPLRPCADASRVSCEACH